MKTRKRQSNESGEFELIVTSERPPEIPEGEYLIQYQRHEIARFFDGLRLYVHFIIISPGQDNGVRIYRTYRLYGPNGRQLRHSSDLYKEIQRVLGQGRLRKNTRFNARVFANKILVCSIRTVKVNRKQQPLSADERYSVIDSIKGVHFQHEPMSNMLMPT